MICRVWGKMRRRTRMPTQPSFSYHFCSKGYHVSMMLYVAQVYRRLVFMLFFPQAKFNNVYFEHNIASSMIMRMISPSCLFSTDDTVCVCRLFCDIELLLCKIIALEDSQHEIMVIIVTQKEILPHSLTLL